MGFSTAQKIVLYEYYSLIEQKYSIKEHLKIGKTSALEPPFVEFNGAYQFAPNVDGFLATFNEDEVLVNNNFVKDINELLDHFNSYRKGFVEGFKNFENNIILPQISLFQDNSNKSQKIFNYATKHRKRNNGQIPFKMKLPDDLYTTYIEGVLQPKHNKLPFDISECYKRQKKTIIIPKEKTNSKTELHLPYCGEKLLFHHHNFISKNKIKHCNSCTQWEVLPVEKWQEKGLEAGYYFRSWRIMIENSEHFAPLFQNNEVKLLPFDIPQQITCHEKDLQSIFNLLELSKIIEGDSKDFIEMFTRNGNPSKPIKWIKKSDRKNKNGEIRGNQKMLYSFLKLMFNNKVTSENQIRASKLFIDHQGEFYNKYKGEVCFVGNMDIEKQLNEILK